MPHVFAMSEIAFEGDSFTSGKFTVQIGPISLVPTNFTDP